MAHSITELEQAYAALERRRRRRGGGEVKGARCPQNSVVVGPLFESATGRTEEEAKRKLHRKLLDRAKKATCFCAV